MAIVPGSREHPGHLMVGTLEEPKTEVMIDKTTLEVQKVATIDAPLEEVWKILTETEYIRQWYDLPMNFPEERLELGSEIHWPGDHTLTVTGLEPFSELELNFFNFEWKDTPEQYGITYTYTLEQQDEQTTLDIMIGDFARIPDGEYYYNEARKFAEKALGKIHDLAEAHILHS